MAMRRSNDLPFQEFKNLILDKNKDFRVYMFFREMFSYKQRNDKKIYQNF